MTKKEKYARIGFGLVAGLAAFKFRKYKWAASALASVAASGIQAGLAQSSEAKPARKQSVDARQPDSSYL